MGIVISDVAVNKLHEMAQKNEIQPTSIRLMVIGGGCSGLTYDMDFETKAKEGDLVFNQDGVTMLVDPASLEYLEGTTIDFVETLSHSGFEFTNPKATRGCGCGKSFTIA